MTPVEPELEAIFIANNASAPSLTLADINAVIVDEQFHFFPGTNHTVCCLKLKNGFTVTGENACVSSANWNAEVGKNMARENARNKVWELEGYLLTQRLFEQQA